jgi:hypothetical protein
MFRGIESARYEILDDAARYLPDLRQRHIYSNPTTEIWAYWRSQARKAANPSGSSQSLPASTPKQAASKATFSADVKPQEDLQDFKKPVDAKATGQAADETGETIEALITLGMERWNDFVTTDPTPTGGPPKISAAEIKALAGSVRTVLEKHGGLEGVSGVTEYLPEISLLIAAGLIGMKMVAGLRYRAGHRPGQTTYAANALRSENPDQSTSKAYEIFERPEVKAEIEKAFEGNRVA